jgi:hypothetical protein
MKAGRVLQILLVVAVAVYGESDPDKAEAYAKTFEVPVLIDPGKQVAKALGVDFFAIVVFGPNGKIIKQKDEGYFTSIPTADDHMDLFLKQ